MDRRKLVKGAMGATAALFTPQISPHLHASEPATGPVTKAGPAIRQDWTRLLVKIVDPVLRSAAGERSSRRCLLKRRRDKRPTGAACHR